MKKILISKHTRIVTILIFILCVFLFFGWRTVPVYRVGRVGCILKSEWKEVSFLTPRNANRIDITKCNVIGLAYKHTYDIHPGDEEYNRIVKLYIPIKAISESDIVKYDRKISFRVKRSNIWMVIAFLQLVIICLNILFRNKNNEKI